MNIAIYGSCVSRDTCEVLPDAQVKAYVARQSVTSLLRPHGSDGVDVSQLQSSFQQRMVLSDLDGAGISQICEHAYDLDLVLVDLVDERRGYWIYPNGTTITNSLEVEASGIARIALEQGAYLINFGEDEHFATWQVGFEKLVQGLETAGILDKSIFLDIEWARYMAGARNTTPFRQVQPGRRWRRLHRGVRSALRSLSKGADLRTAIQKMTNVEPTLAETFFDKAETANSQFKRYSLTARKMLPMTISRQTDELRIDPNHKWGPQPFHFRADDYRSIVKSIQSLVNVSNIEAEKKKHDR